jgi:O-antigen ligase
MLAAHPLVGIGPDNFRLAYGEYAGIVNADPRVHSNSMYVEVLAGGGIVGGLAFLWLCWRTGKMFIASAREAVDRKRSMLGAGIAAAGAAIALHGFVDSFLSFTATYILIAITVGLAASFDERNTADANRI